MTRDEAKANKRIEPMTSSAICRRFQSHVVDALLVTAHPHRSARSSMGRLWTLLLMSAVATLLGCSRTVTGGFTDSPDKKYRMYGRVYGALGKAFLDETKKTVRLSIVLNNAQETLLFRKELGVKGSDVSWDCTWDKEGNVSVVVFDYGPHVYWEDARKAGTPSNPLANISLVLDRQTGKFHTRN